uniref:Uncharacterized protein n=1 Tax=Rhizophora mucronata TaxID=61149 RepID=A0A2P2PCS7_RHIMU
MFVRCCCGILEAFCTGIISSFSLLCLAFECSCV